MMKPENSKPNELERTAIQFERFVADAAGCEIQPGRLTLTFRRAAPFGATPEFNSECTCACHRTSCIRTDGREAFLSLLAHEPNPAGRSSIGTRRLITSNLFLLLARQLDSGVRAKLVSNAAAKLDSGVQFTNRRMRTFIATPSARNANSTEDPP